MKFIGTEQNKLKPYYLIGPTAVGKTSVAQFIAHKQGWDILSADSMLVYRGMNIGTAKPTVQERGSVNYYGIDLVDPNKQFSAWSYMEYCESVSEELKECIITGGTGLYVQSLLGGLSDMPGADEDLRSEWSQRVALGGIERLQKYMQSNLPDVYNALSDKKNLRRLIRAVEIADGGVKEIDRSWRGVSIRVPGLMMSTNELNRRIESRVEKMFSDGLIDEVKVLLENYDTLSKTALQAIGYSEAIAYINGDCSLESAKEKIKTRTRRLAKRQMTWFRNQMDVDWMEIDSEMEVSEIAGLVLDYWENNGPAQIREI